MLRAGSFYRHAAAFKAEIMYSRLAGVMPGCTGTCTRRPIIVSAFGHEAVRMRYGDKRVVARLI